MRKVADRMAPRTASPVQRCAPRHTGNIHWRNTAEQLRLVGPASLGVSLLTAGFVGMVFTIQVRLHLQGRAAILTA
jgi:ABC-type transporter Mla maintaining outer membrane lipid asymmetry permease subunit MlaE